jgi:hypothetical protein
MPNLTVSCKKPRQFGVVKKTPFTPPRLVPFIRALYACMEIKTNRLHWVFLLVAFALACVSMSASERWETLQAINWVENPHNSLKAGPCGELGPYQFRRSTWYMHTTKPFALAVQRQHADDVAVRHYDWIKRSLERNGIAATPFNIALAWNAGLDQVVDGRAPSAAYQYASQVSNLVEHLKSQQYVSTR